MSFKNKLALIGIPLLVVALAAAVYIAPKETSTQSRASSSQPCEKKCQEDYKGKPNNLNRCLEACRSKSSGSDNWRLNADIRPLYCTLAASAIATLGQPTKTSDYKPIRDNILTSLESEQGSGPGKLIKELSKFSSGDTEKSYQKYCIERSQDE